MPKKTLKQLLYEVDPDLNIVSNSQHRHGSGAFPLPPSVQELYNIAEAQEKRLERVERILKLIPENVIEEIDTQGEDDLSGEEPQRILAQLRSLEERKGITIHNRIKISNVVLSIINNDCRCLRPESFGRICPCDDPLANGCNFFNPRR
ncbi:MAG: hypothetical protein PHO67_08040 [Candidatus Omnitrophica bacterium]|nr:hypothetical protein [Candidatus Omnitrophota bacterium]